MAGTLAPGNSPGTTIAGGDVTLARTATYRVEIDGPIYDAAGGAGTYDRVVLTGPNRVFTADGTLAPVLRGITAPATNSFTPSSAAASTSSRRRMTAALWGRSATSTDQTTA